MDLPRPLRLALLIAASLLLLLIADFVVLRHFFREDRLRQVSTLLDALATGEPLDSLRLTRDLTALVPGTKVALIDGHGRPPKTAEPPISNDDFHWLMVCTERTTKACVRHDLAAVKVPAANGSWLVALTMLPALQLSEPTLKMFCGLALLSLACASALYWLITSPIGTDYRSYRAQWSSLLSAASLTPLLLEMIGWSACSDRRVGSCEPSIPDLKSMCSRPGLN